MKEIFKAGRIYTEQQTMDDAYLVVEDGRISELLDDYTGMQPVHDHTDKIIIPGIIDIHSHGCMGYSATCKDMDEVYGFTKAIAATGVTGVFATTQEFDSMAKVADVIDSGIVKGSRILGIQAEGPFRHPKYMGASKGFDWPKPSVDYAKQMNEAAKGHLKYMSVSTDLEGIEAVMQYLLSQNIRIAAGHTDADYEEMKKGFKMGATSISHFGNAMRPIHQRSGGAITACLLNEDIILEIICDHVHLAPEIIDLYFRVKDSEHFILISDSSELACMPAGRYYARGKERIVTEAGHIVLDDGTISGSGKYVLYDMRNLIFKHQMPADKVIKMASLQPAKYFHLEEKKGSIAIGKDADFVILDQDWHVVQTYVEGIKQYDCQIHTQLINPAMKNLLAV